MYGQREKNGRIIPAGVKCRVSKTFRRYYGENRQSKKRRQKNVRFLNNGSIFYVNNVDANNVNTVVMIDTIMGKRIELKSLSLVSLFQMAFSNSK